MESKPEASGWFSTSMMEGKTNFFFHLPTLKCNFSVELPIIILIVVLVSNFYSVQREEDIGL